MRRVWIIPVLALATVTAPFARGQRVTENVVLIVSDGLRWQEMFRGPERALLSRAAGGVSDTVTAIRDYWRDDVGQRRRNLFPFIWSTVASQGQIFGNQDRSSTARIENTFKFSYPGYSEMLTGWFDPRIDSNEYPPNPNVTVFEWLAKRPEFRGKVGAVATWGAFHRIFNPDRAGLDVIAGWAQPFMGDLARTPTAQMINELYRTNTRYWKDNAFDAPMQLALKEYLRAKMPRVLFVGYGETDEWAHGGRYDLVLHSAQHMDALTADLWSTMQAMPQYRGKTTFIITTDHGRGGGDREWKNHGADVVGAENVWIAVLGPDTPALGERGNIPPVTQSQIAATIAALLGLGDAYRASAAKAAAPITGVLRR